MILKFIFIKCSYLFIFPDATLDPFNFIKNETGVSKSKGLGHRFLPNIKVLYKPIISGLMYYFQFFTHKKFLKTYLETKSTQYLHLVQKLM